MQYLASLALVLCLACGDSVSSPTETTSVPSTIRAGGSTTLYQGVFAGAQAFMAANPNIHISVSQSSTGSGIEQVLAGKLDLANASRAPKQRELEAGRAGRVALKAYQVGYDALALVVHPRIGKHVRSIDREQVRAIFFEGTVRDWSAVHPELSGSINVYVRDQQVSGSAAAFTKHMTGRDDTPFAKGVRSVQRSTELCPSVAKDPSGIAFAPFHFVDHTVQALAYSEDNRSPVAPELATIRDLSYPLRRDLYLITDGTPSGHLNDFVQFMFNRDGQSAIEKAGLTGLR